MFADARTDRGASAAERGRSGIGGVPDRLLLPIVAGGLLLVFLAAPWSLEHKAHAALHGLCAQRPSHSFSLGGQTLPFDARMTGIYGGFLTVAVYLVARRRHVAARLPTWPVMAVLALFVAALAVDGFNSLLLDLGHWHPYDPDNRLRLATGLATGATLAVVMNYLTAVSIWRRPKVNQRVVDGRDLLILPLCVAPFAAVVLSSASIAYVPLVLALLIAAVALLGMLALVVIVLFRQIDGSFERPADVQRIAAAGLAAGVVVMAGFAAARFALEELLGTPPLT